MSFDDPTFQHAVDAKVSAGVNVDKAVFTAKKLVTEAEGTEAEIKNEADAEAYGVLQNAQQEADAITREGDALKSNPSLVQLTAIGAWQKHLPRVVGQTVPYTSVTPAQAPRAPAAN